MNMPFRDTECHLAHPGAFLCPTERSTLVRRLSQARPGSIHSETQGGSHLSLPRKAARGSFLQDTEFCSPQSLFLPEDIPASGKKWLRGEHGAHTGSEAARLAGPSVPSSHLSAAQEEAHPWNCLWRNPKPRLPVKSRSPTYPFPSHRWSVSLRGQLI